MKNGIQHQINSQWINELSNLNTESKLAVTIRLDKVITKTQSNKQIKKLYKRLNRLIFKHGYKKHGHRLFLITTVKINNNGNVKIIYLSLGVPKTYQQTSFIKLLNLKINRLTWMDNIGSIDIRPLSSVNEMKQWNLKITEHRIQLDLFEPQLFY